LFGRRRIHANRAPVFVFRRAYAIAGEIAFGQAHQFGLDDLDQPASILGEVARF
jgi:hypothetical protein